ITLAGGSVLRTEVGDRNVVTSMRKIGANIGGESSGHIIFLDSATTGDGLLAALHLINLLRDADCKLSKLQAKYRLFPQETISLRVAQKLPLGDLQEIQQAISAAETELGTDGRVLIRYSGTESKIRLLVEGKDSEMISSLISKLEKSVCEDLNVLQ
ncbi:MAG: phosphoglucosamine mutase, partial [Verrucomicrobiota bacterium]|nr:phosphoglucosamine mutase [Verrucomicrobiota bacterium]